MASGVLELALSHHNTERGVSYEMHRLGNLVLGHQSQSCHGSSRISQRGESYRDMCRAKDLIFPSLVSNPNQGPMLSSKKET